MQSRRKLNRRSFLAIVSGAAISGGALAGLDAEARAAQGTDQDPGDAVGHGRRGGVTDRDPTDAAHRGRGARGQSNSGYSDSDPTDASGNGRGGGAARSGYSDSDPSDPSGNGRGGTAARSGCSDSDPTDPGGNGRTCSTRGSGSAGTGGQGSGAYQTGRRERRYEVCWVDHPSRTNEECNIQTYSEWAITWSDGRVEYDTSESLARNAEMTRRGYTARWNRMIVNEW